MNRLSILRCYKPFIRISFATPCLQVNMMHKSQSFVSLSKRSIPFLRCLGDGYTLRCTGIQFSNVNSEDTFIKRLKKKIYAKISDPSKISAGACRAYENSTDNLPCQDIFKYFNLPDSFNSWFIVVQLHVWMIIVTTISYKNGRLFRNKLTEEMWNDVEQRLGQLTEVRSSERKKYLGEMSAQFKAALMSYDEGFLNDDKALAASVWRTFYAFNTTIDPRLLESMVVYIRKQTQHLEYLNCEEVMFRGAISFLPLKDVISDFDKK